MSGFKRLALKFIIQISLFLTASWHSLALPTSLSPMNCTWINKLPPIALHSKTHSLKNHQQLLQKHRTIAQFKLKELLPHHASRFPVHESICRNSAYSSCSFTFLNKHFPPIALLSKRSYSSQPEGPEETRHHIFSVADKNHDTTDIPSFQESLRPRATTSSSKMFTYLIVGAGGVVAGTATKSSIINFLSVLAPTSKTIASGIIEVDLAAVPEARNMVLKWRGKPVFIRHRTAAEIEEACAVDVSKLRDPQPDSDRAKKPEYLIMIGVCTHLGCVPIGEAGDYGGWYCPCHGSHYDISGRIRQGPAPLNLEIPPHRYIDETRVVIG